MGLTYGNSQRRDVRRGQRPGEECTDIGYFPEFSAEHNVTGGGWSEVVNGDTFSTTPSAPPLFMSRCALLAQHQDDADEPISPSACPPTAEFPLAHNYLNVRNDTNLGLRLEIWLTTVLTFNW